MGTILAILSQLNKANKTVKKAVHRGFTIKEVYSNPSILIRMIIDKVLSILKGAVLGFIIDFGWIILVIAILIGGASYLFSSYKVSNGDSYGEIEKDLSSWSSSLSSDELKDFEEMGLAIDPRYMKEYFEIEKNSYPKTVSLNKRITTTVIDSSNRKSTSERSEKYNLNLESVAKKYRLWWQLLMGLDTISGQAKGENSSHASLMASAKTQLTPTFSWGYDKYTKDVTTSLKEFKEEYKNGQLIKTTMIKQTDTTEYYPLPILNSVSTALADYYFEIEEDIVTKDTAYENYGDRVQSESTYEYYESVSGKYVYVDGKYVLADSSNSTYEVPKYGDVGTGKYIYYESTNGKYVYIDGKYVLADSSNSTYEEPVYEWIWDFWGLPKRVIVGTKVVYRTRYDRKELTEHGQIGTTTKERKRYDRNEYYSVNYKQKKTKVVEDVTSTTGTSTNTAKLDSYLQSNNLTRSDLALVQAMFSGEFGDAPPSEEFVQLLESAIDEENFNKVIGGTGGEGGAGGSSNIQINPSEIVGDIPLFTQWDSRWGNIMYSGKGDPSDTIKTSGCGPTSFSMIATGFKSVAPDIDLNKDGILDPYEACAYSLKRGHRTASSGTSWGYFADIGGKCGFKVKQVGKSQYQEVLTALQKGNPVIASFSRGHFTGGGHYVLFIGVNKEGKIITRDPNYSNSPQKWIAKWTKWGTPYTQQQVQDFYKMTIDPDVIIKESKQYWIFSR